MKKQILIAIGALALMPSLAYAADEVVVSERLYPGMIRYGVPVEIQGYPVTTQVLDIATESAAFSEDTNYILICNNAGAVIWYKLGPSGVSAAANTNGNEYLPSGACREEPLRSTDTNIDTAADS